MSQKRPELLIPASSLEVLKTAVMFGADAVYIGGEAFGLRAKAKNFSMEDMKDILVQYYAITGFVAGSPREVLREAFKANLISDDAWMRLLSQIPVCLSWQRKSAQRFSATSARRRITRIMRPISSGGSRELPV